MEQNKSKKQFFISIFFNPFDHFSGIQSLIIGVLLIVLACFIGSLSKTHFDGVLDFHFGKSVPLWFFFYEGLVDLLSITIFLMIGNFILKGKLDTVNTLGSQALARSPMVFISLIPLSHQFRTVSAKIAAYPRNINQIILSDTSEFVVFSILVIIVILMIIWMVYLMYAGFSKYSDATKPKKISIFILSLILAEILSKKILIESFATI